MISWPVVAIRDPPAAPESLVQVFSLRPDLVHKEVGSWARHQLCELDSAADSRRMDQRTGSADGELSWSFTGSFSSS